MVIRQARFNFILLLAAFTVCAGCQTTDKNKDQAVLRIHLEVNADAPELSSEVPVFRAHPVLVNVQKLPFLAETDVDKVDVVNTIGGFALQIRFNHSGTDLLEQYSSMYPGRHFAIFCQFGPEKESRWLGAPQINRRITDGSLIFTPDCTRAEADEIALGLNNAANQREKRSLIKQ